MEFKPKSPEMLFSLFNEYSHENILKSVNMLSNDTKRAVELYYGLNGNKSISKTEIEKIVGIPEKNIRERIYIAKKQILNILVKGNFTKETIFDLYPKYSKEEVLKAKNKLSPERKKIIELYYGLNDNVQLKPKDISKLLNINLKSVQKEIPLIKKQIEKNLKTSQIKKEIEVILEPKYLKRNITDSYPGYTKEQILDVINTLSDEKQKIIKLYYGIENNTPLKPKKISKILNINLEEIQNNINVIKNQISRRLASGQIKKETIINETSKYTKKEITDSYPGYTLEQILGVINTLSDEKQKIIKLYYGIENNISLKPKEISEILKISLEEIQNKIHAIKSQILRRLEKGIFKHEEIFDLYPEYTKEQILGAISTLNEKNKRIIELKYGLNGKDYTETKDIAEYFNTTVAKINSLYWTINNQILRRLEKGQFKEKQIFDLYPKYTKEQVLGTISTLDKLNKKIIELKYGLNGEKYTETKDIATLFNTSRDKISKTIVSIQKQISRRLEKGIFKQEEIFDLYPEYTKEQVLNAINSLNDDNKRIINLRYGLNGNTAISNIELKKHYQVHRADARVYSIIKQISKRLEKAKKERKMIFNSYPVYSEKQVLDVINTLSDEKKKIIELRYGLNNNGINQIDNISKKLNIPVQKVYEQLKLAKSQIKRRLIKKYNNNIQIIDCSKESQNDKENIKKLIDMIDNPKEKEVLLLRLGCINDKYYTEEEIAKILRINKNDINILIKSGLSKMSSLSCEKQKTIMI